MSNPYETLGVPQNATQEEIKKAYRNLTKKYHPDVYKGEDGEQKIREINQAYEIIGDEEKRRIYDLSLDETKSDYNYENLTKEQQEYLERLKKQKAFEIIVENELNKIEVIISLKSNLEISALNGVISNEEYYKEVVRINNETTKYISNLNELQEEAIKKDMFYIKDRIDYVISTLSELIESLPLSLTELINNERKQARNVTIKNKINEVIGDVNYNINEISNLLIELNKKQISKIDYANFRESYIIILKNSISDINQLIELAKNDGLTELDDLNILKTRCELCLQYMDSDVEKASQYADCLMILKEREKLITDWFTIYKVKLDKITSILLKHPKAKHFETLFFYAEQIMSEQRKKLRDFSWYNTDFKSKDEDVKNISLIFLNKEYDPLSTLEISIEIDQIYRSEFEKNFANLSLLRRLPCEAEYYYSGTNIPTIGKLIDLYRLNRFGRRNLPIVTGISAIGSVISSLTIPLYCFATQNKELIPIELGICLTIGGISAAVGAHIAYKRADVREDYYYEEIYRNKEYKKVLNYKRKII